MTDLMIINIFCVWIVKVSSKSPSQAEVKLLVCGFKCSAPWHARAGWEGVMLYMWNFVVLFYYYYWVNHAYLKRKLEVNPLSRWINILDLSYLAHSLNYQKAYVLIIKGFGVPRPLIFLFIISLNYSCLVFLPIFWSNETSRSNGLVITFRSIHLAFSIFQCVELARPPIWFPDFIHICLSKDQPTIFYIHHTNLKEIKKYLLIESLKCWCLEIGMRTFFHEYT